MNKPAGKLVQYLKHYDPATVDEVRLNHLSDCIISMARCVPQDAPIIGSRLIYGRAISLLPRVGLAVMLLALGMIAGQVRQAREEAGALLTQAQSPVSVMAMVEPWEGWIEVKE